MYIEEGVMIALTGAVVKLIDVVYAYIKDKTTESDTSKIEKMDEKLDKLVKHGELMDALHTKYDENGIPLWYIPRSMITSQYDSKNEMVNLAHSQATMSRSMERTTQSLENIVKILTILEERASNRNN